MVLRLAVREIQAHDVDAGADHLDQDVGSVEAGPMVATILVPRCMDIPLFLLWLRRLLRARCCRISTAGRVFPSRNSRKAPPPVEM
jgi:hypothetical protein